MEKLDIRQNIKNNLIDLRMKKGLTQLEIAEICDKKMTTVSSWEQGVSLPDIYTLHKLATYYGVTMEYLCENSAEGSDFV